jgi:hypothetical protein
MTWSILIASAAVVFSVISYVLSRRRELAWKRTEFICAQAEYFDNDPDLVEVVSILEERHPNIKVEDIFGVGSKIDSQKRSEYKQKFDKMFNFLWRLCFAYLETKTLSSKEVEAFGWYFWRMSQFPTILHYCAENGFSSINVAIKQLKLDEEGESDFRISSLLNGELTSPRLSIKGEKVSDPATQLPPAPTPTTKSS